jgi:hypothetical protein
MREGAAISNGVVIGAALAHRVGYGGHAWALLQYVHGFRSLGFDVTFVDRLEPGMAVEGDHAALRYVDALLAPDRIPYVVLGTDGMPRAGIPRAEALERVRSARFLLNAMGFVRDAELLSAARRRVFLDIDPGFAQIWRELGLADLFVHHDDFVTVGRSVGREDCGVPTGGLDWITMPHPIVLERCPVVADGTAFTSVGSWRGPYAPLQYNGKTLGLRVHEFRKFADLPTRVDGEFRVALEIDPSDERDIALLEQNGWILLRPRDVASDPASYLGFIQSSFAEFSVAKGVYVDLRTGWLGDRTVAYLASGKPALVQDTGLAEHYPLGEGLLAFSTVDEAVAGAQEIARNHGRHAAAARRIASDHFDARTVLSRLLEELG